MTQADKMSIQKSSYKHTRPLKILWIHPCITMTAAYYSAYYAAIPVIQKSYLAYYAAIPVIQKSYYAAIPVTYASILAQFSFRLTPFLVKPFAHFFVLVIYLILYVTCKMTVKQFITTLSGEPNHASLSY